MWSTRVKGSGIGTACVAVLLQTGAVAAELPDCQLDQGAFPGSVLRSFVMKDQTRYFMEVQGALRNGTDVSYERDEAVLNVDLKVVRTSPALVPSGDVTLKSSWALSYNYSFAKDRPLPYRFEVELKDGRRFGMLEFNSSRSALFVDQSGTFCNQTLSVKPDMQVWIAGTLSKVPDDVVFERKLHDEEVKSGSLRIIFLGTTAGAMNFQEVWVQGSRIGKSIARPFDQFAKSIEIAGFKFQVIEAKSDRVKLRYDIADRTEITAGQSGQIALQNKQ